MDAVIEKVESFFSTPANRSIKQSNIKGANHRFFTTNDDRDESMYPAIHANL